MSFDNLKIDESWTLFLDRDGVINVRPMNDYVKSPAGFEFMPNVLEALRTLSNIFTRIIVVTNQQGIGKHLMTSEDLLKVHEKMIFEIENSGGRINKVYYCPDLAKKKNNCRKPGLKMAQQAKTDFPEIDFSKSIMVGDTASDIEFGKNAGMYTVFINNSSEYTSIIPFDVEFSSLSDFAKSVIAND